MKYKIVTSGTTKFLAISEISRNLKVQSDVFILSDKEIYLGSIYNKTLVFFATEFADYALQNYAKKKTPEAEICISLAKKWLQDNTSVSSEELIAAAYAADTIAYAAYAAYAAVDTAAAYAADAAYDAAVDTAADAAVDAAVDTAADTAHAADSVYADAEAEGDKEFIRQGEFILDFLKSGKNLFLI